jgi:hypothetical protein
VPEVQTEERRLAREACVLHGPLYFLKDKESKYLQDKKQDKICPGWRVSSLVEESNIAP